MRVLILSAALTVTAQAQLTVLSPTLARASGTDPETHSTYTTLSLNATTANSFDITQPTLTAQCTQDASGKLRFDLLINFGNVADTAPYQPWRPTAAHPTKSPPRYTVITLDFFGYRKVRPLKAEFEALWIPDGQYRYNPSGMHSNNMEDAAIVLQYLRALPTLRATHGAQRADFLTTPLLARLHDEPLCRAAGL